MALLLALVLLLASYATFVPLNGTVAASGGNSFDIVVDPTRTYGDLSAVGEYSLPPGADYTIAQWSKLGNTSYFLTTDGRVYALGASANGAAGIGANPPKDILRAPERVWAGEAALDGSGNWEEIGGVKYLANIVSIAAPFAWDAAGRLYVWGINALGCLGINSSDFSLIAYTPVRVRAHVTLGHPSDYETLPANGTFAAGTYVTNVEAMNGGQRAGYVTKGDHRFYTWGASDTWYSYCAFQATQGYAPRPVPAGEASDAALGHPDDCYTIGSTKYLQNVDSYFINSEESLVACGGRLYACGRNRSVGGPTWPTTLSYAAGLKRLSTGANVLAADSETVGGRTVFKGVTKVMHVTYNTYIWLTENGNMYGSGCNRWGMLNMGSPDNSGDQSWTGSSRFFARIPALADATADGNFVTGVGNDGSGTMNYFANIVDIIHVGGGWWAIAADGHCYATGQNTGGLLGTGDDVTNNVQGKRVRAGGAANYGAPLQYYFEPGDGKRYLKWNASMNPNNTMNARTYFCYGVFIGDQVLLWGDNSSQQLAVYDGATNIFFGLTARANDYLPRVYMNIEDIENNITYLDAATLDSSGAPYQFNTRIFNNGLYRMEIATPPFMVFEKEIPINTIGRNDFSYSLFTTLGDDVRTADLHFTPYFSDNEIAAVAAGNSYTAILTPDRLIYTWGANDPEMLASGVLGLGAASATHSPTPRRVLAGDAALDGSGNFVEFGGVKYLSKIEKMFAAYNHMVAITFDGQVYAWGNNQEGQLGIGSSGNNQDVPRRVLAGDAATVVSAGEAGLYHEYCAANGGFAAGNYLRNIGSVGFGRYNSAFLTKNTGLAFLAGKNNASQLANNSTAAAVAVPIRLRAGNMIKKDLYSRVFSPADTYETVGSIAYARRIKKIAFGNEHMVVLTVHNCPFVSGSNAQRQSGLIGGGDPETGESPAVAAGTDHLRLIAAGQSATYAGVNVATLGFTGSTAVVPYNSGIGTGIKDIAAAPQATALLTNGGQVLVMGNVNTYGQNGHNTAAPHYDNNYPCFVRAGEAETDGSPNWQRIYSRTGAGNQMLINKVIQFGAFTGECFTMMTLDGCLYSIGRSNGTAAYLGRTGVAQTASPVRISAGAAAGDPDDFETVGTLAYFKSPGSKLTASGNNLIITTPMLNYYAFGAVEGAPIFGTDVHDKISDVLFSAQRDVELVGPYFNAPWPEEPQGTILGLTAQQEYIVNVPENGVYLAKMYYNGQLSNIDSVAVTELDHIDLSKSLAAGPQNKLDYGFYLRHKYQPGTGETVDDDLWILGPAGTGPDQFPTALPGAGPALMHITAAQLQALYDGGNNLEHIAGSLNINQQGVYTAVIERAGTRLKPDPNAWRIVQAKKITFEEYTVTEKYQDDGGAALDDDTFAYVMENLDYAKTPPDLSASGWYYIGWKLDGGPLQNGTPALAGVLADHEVILVYNDVQPPVLLLVLEKSSDADLPIGSGKCDVGDTVTYHVNVSNAGNLEALGAVFSDQLAPGMDYVPDSAEIDGVPVPAGNAVYTDDSVFRTLTIGLGAIPAGVSHDVSFQVLVNGNEIAENENLKYLNQAVVLYHGLGDEEDTASYSNVHEIGLELRPYGGTITDCLPEGLTITGHDDADADDYEWDPVGRIVTWTWDALPTGTTTVRVRAKVTEALALYKNQAFFTIEGEPPVPTNFTYHTCLRKLHIRQIVLSPLSGLQLPVMGYYTLQNDGDTLPLTSDSVAPGYLFTSYSMLLGGIKRYTLTDIVPQYYEFVGHIQNDGGAPAGHRPEAPFAAIDLTANGDVELDYTNTGEIWITVYITPRGTPGLNQTGVETNRFGTVYKAAPSAPPLVVTGECEDDHMIAQGNTYANIPGTIVQTGVQYAKLPNMTGQPDPAQPNPLLESVNNADFQTPWDQEMPLLYFSGIWYYRAFVINDASEIFYGEIKSYSIA